MKKSLLIAPLFIALIAIDTQAQIAEAPEILVRENVRGPIINAPQVFERNQSGLDQSTHYIKINPILQKPFRSRVIDKKKVEKK